MNREDSVTVDDVRRTVRKLQRTGYLTADAGTSNLVSMDCIPLLAESLGFRKKTVRALRAELAEVQREREEEHIASASVAGRQYGWISFESAASILRGQGKSFNVV